MGTLEYVCAMLILRDLGMTEYYAQINDLVTYNGDIVEIPHEQKLFLSQKLRLLRVMVQV